ncbi:Rv1733c family protein [Streptomyces nigra]|uniref:Rv1733c family protein n=1 Tax=Streptomyces nigra TaxID=1827580 RepID=UPI000D528C94|nr:hypothetical protein [Streptomyces nigra]AWE48450.1 hypothetical protein DC008_01125 [Streptomyces nigra]
MNAQGSPGTSPTPRKRHVSLRANPLRRPSDRFEWWFHRFLLALLVVGLPVAGYSAGTTAYEASMRTVRNAAAERHQATARATVDVPRVGNVAKQPVPVRWTEENDTVRTGAALVKPGTSKGAAVAVWVDRSGNVTSPPASALNAKATGWITGAIVACGTGFGVSVLWAGARLLPDRRRYAQWDAEWDRTEPLWSARFGR